jgi:hypothetical protein
LKFYESLIFGKKDDLILVLAKSQKNDKLFGSILKPDSASYPE